MNKNMFSTDSPTQKSSPVIELPDQQSLGPGQWFTIHKTAKRAINEEKKRRFVDFMNDVCEEMRCSKCKAHMSEYMKNNSFAPYWNYKDIDGTQIGMFKWSWIFHNSVNSRLNKPYVDWETAKRMYYTAHSSPSAVPLACTNGGCNETPTNKQKFSIIQALTNTSNQKIYYKGSRDDFCKFNVCQI